MHVGHSEVVDDDVHVGHKDVLDANTSPVDAEDSETETTDETEDKVPEEDAADAGPALEVL